MLTFDSGDFHLKILQFRLPQLQIMTFKAERLNIFPFFFLSCVLQSPQKIIHAHKDAGQTERPTETLREAN